MGIRWLFLCLLAGALAWAGETHSAPTPEFRARVEACAKRLGSESFDEREKATLEMFEFGPDVLVVLREIERTSSDAEQKARLQHVCAWAECKEPKNVEAARLKFLRCLRAELLPESGKESKYWKQLGTSREALKTLEKLGKEKVPDLFWPDLKYEASMLRYEYFHKTKDQDALEHIRVDMDEAVKEYGAHLDNHPEDKDVENRQHQANMISYAARRFRIIK